MGTVTIKITGVEQLTAKLKRMSAIRFDAVYKKQLTQMLNRARQPGGTPVDTGELRKSSSVGNNEMGYVAAYASHVEFGHRTRGGGWVPGQKFLQANVNAQIPIFKQDLKDAIRKG